VSAPGEILPTHEFYSYEAKYLDEKGAKLFIPAQITPAQIVMAQKIAREVFELLECEGMARVDLFLDKETGEFYFNEINTIPGFTSISMYPKLWEYSGVPYQELLSRLIDLAIARHKRKKSLLREFKA
jgi:D-alanine-D-alanine ligase